MANILVKNQEILISIKRLGINGEGIGYYKRLAVFVPFAIPGEDVVVRITEVHDTYSKGEVVKIKSSSDDRVTPECNIFQKCGGCQLQHINYEKQLSFKKEIVIESFQRYYNGHLNINVFKDTIGMDFPYSYRNKAKHPIRYDGTKLVSGLYAMDSNVLVYVEDCLIEKKDLKQALKDILNHLTKSQIIAFNLKSNDGVLRHIIIRSSKFSKEIQVTFVLYKEDTRTINILKEVINITNVKSVYVSINNDLSQLETFGEKTYLLEGTDAIVEQIGEYKFNLLPTAFLQLNIDQTEKLYEQVKLLARLKGYEKLVDACCGVGTIGLYLSKFVKEVRGVDISKEAIKNAIENVKLNEVKNASYYCGDISVCLAKWAKDGFVPDVLVIDPPRLGMELRLINYLQEHPVKKIIYVSCNSATLAKNCNHLQKSYHILKIQPLDMFPQTSNVECVVCLERR